MTVTEWKWQKVLYELGSRTRHVITEGRTTTSSSQIRLRAGGKAEVSQGGRKFPANFLLELETGFGDIQIEFTIEELEEMTKKAREYLQLTSE